MAVSIFDRVFHIFSSKDLTFNSLENHIIFNDQHRFDDF